MNVTHNFCYCRRLFIRYEEEIKQKFYEIAEQSVFSILDIEVDQDHIHLLVKSVPKIGTLQIAKRMKQFSTDRIWENDESELQKQFWKERTFRSDGYFVCSFGNVSKAIVEKYIRTKANTPQFIRAAKDRCGFLAKFYKTSLLTQTKPIIPAS